VSVEKTATITVSKTKLKTLIENNMGFLVGKGNEELLKYEVMSVDDKTRRETYLIGNFDADYVDHFDGLTIRLKSK